MFYLEDEYTDFIVGDPIREDALYMMADEDKAEGKDPAGDKSPKEEGTKEAEEGAEAKDEAPDEEQAEEEAKDEESVEEETQSEEVASQEDPEVEASTEKEAEETAEDVVEGETVEETQSEEEVASQEDPEVEVSTEKEAEETAEDAVEEPAASEDSESSEKDKEPSKPEMDSEEAAYVAKQTEIIKATYSDIRKDLPKFRPGDKISVGYRVIEGDRSRIQNYDGVVIKISSGHGMDKTFTVRKVSSGIGVERIFPLNSPNIKSIKVLKEGHVRRAKLYYLRGRVGKATRIKEKTSP